MTRLLKTALAVGLGLMASTALTSFAAEDEPAGNMAGFSGGPRDEPRDDNRERGSVRIVRPDADNAGATRRWRCDIGRFHQNDYLIWNRGRWFHGDHEGQGGWWWVIGDSWYFYNTPTYPFPDPYTPGEMSASGTAPDAPADATPPASDTPPPTPTYWYYCEDPQGYYPYVATCNGDWQPVTPTPPK